MSFPTSKIAPTGRAKCLQCKERVEKGSVKVEVERVVDTPMGERRSAGSLHPKCVEAWVADNRWPGGMATFAQAVADNGEVEVPELAGAKGGAKAAAEPKGTPHAGKTSLETLVEAAPEAAPEDVRTPFPDFPERPVDGPYRSTYAGSDQVEYEGEFVDGQRHGPWRLYWPSGQLEWEVDWVHGLRHGRSLGFHENGQKHYEGTYVNGELHGPWEYFYEDGAFRQRYEYERGKKTGDYVLDWPDGRPRVRGAFRNGERFGEWIFHQDESEPHERVEHGFLKGANHGSHRGWYHGGQLAYDRHFHRSRRVGTQKEYYADGSPKTIAEYDERGHKRRVESFDEAGKSTVSEFPSPFELPESLVNDQAKLQKLGAKLAKLKDELDKKDAIRDVADGDYNLAGPLLLHLFRADYYDLGGDPDLWRDLTLQVGQMTGEDVAKLLRQVPDSDAKKYSLSSLLPGWHRDLDAMVMKVYLRDPGPIDAVFGELKGRVKRGLAFCLARFGNEEARKVLGDQGKAIAAKQVRDGLGDLMLWPKGDTIEELSLFHHGADGSKEPTEHFGRFLELTSNVDTYAEAMLAEVMKKANDGRDVRIGWRRRALQRATPEQLVTILENAESASVAAVEKLFFEWRQDDAATVERIALAMEPTAHNSRRWPVVSCAILKHAEEGNSIPEALVEALELASFSSDYLGWVGKAIVAANPKPEQQANLYRRAKAAVFADVDSPGAPDLGLLMRAMRKLSNEQRERLIRTRLEDRYMKAHAAPFLFLVDDEALWEEAIETIVTSDYPGGDVVAFGLGTLPASAIPMLLGAKKKAKKKKECGQAYERAALLSATRALERGESLDAKALKAIRFSLWRKDDWSRVQPILLKAVCSLPRKQGEKVLLAALGSGKAQEFARAFRLVGSHPTREVLQAAMEGLLDLEEKLKNDDIQEIRGGFEGMESTYVDERRALIKWFLMNGGGSRLKGTIENVLGTKVFTELEKEIAEGGTELAKELGPIELLQKLAAATGGTPRVPIYVFQKLAAAPAKPTLNRLGGLPPGVSAEDWPTFDDEPMEHLVTLDLATMPELQAQQGGARTLSFFCHSPDHNEAYEPGTGQTAVLTGGDGDGAAPEGVEVRPEKHFEAVRIEVPAGVFSARSGKLRELHDAIYKMGGRALGEPIWLQQDEGGSDGFVMQFDETFVDMNLGDSGIMYVYADDAFWQCH